MTLRLGIDVGGTNTDAALVDGADTVLATAKRPTSADVRSGVRDALRAVLAGQDPASIDLAIVGTTQCTNAIVQRRGLSKIGVIRIGAPATTAISPLADWPADLADAVLVDSAIIGGGHHFDGRRIAPLDTDALRDIAGRWHGRVDAIAVTGVFAPGFPADEIAARELLHNLVTVPISLSHEIGRFGLLERESATALNASLTSVVRVATDGLTDTLASEGVIAPVYLSQNDGTLMSLERALRYPVLTIASGPTNSLRGAALLSGHRDAVVIDVGGTTADFGALIAGFPRESAIAVEIGGTHTNFRMPDLVSIGVGGGTVVRAAAPDTPGDGRARRGNGPAPANADVSIGPDSVGHDIATRARCFGGDTLTLTDVLLASGAAVAGLPALEHVVDEQVVTQTLFRLRSMLEQALDTMRTSIDPVPVIAVGGGSFLVPDELDGATRVLRPPHHDVANAVGATITEVSGVSDRVFAGAELSRAEILEQSQAEARADAVDAGAASEGLRTVEVEETQLAYLPGGGTRVRTKVVGQLDLSAIQSRDSSADRRSA